jgi:hypothetical protein
MTAGEGVESVDVMVLCLLGDGVVGIVLAGEAEGLCFIGECMIV